LNIFEIVEIDPTEEATADWAVVFFLSKARWWEGAKNFGRSP
jgi:hypothetical protein